MMSTTLLQGPYVFLSYPRSEEAFTKRLEQDLQAHNLQVWRDESNIKPGSPDWEATIRNAISHAYAVILIASPRVASSLYIKGELNLAKRHHPNRIYPVWMNGTEWSDCVPIDFINTQYIDMRQEKYTLGLNALTKALHKAKERPLHLQQDTAVHQQEGLSSPSAHIPPLGTPTHEIEGERVLTPASNSGGTPLAASSNGPITPFPVQEDIFPVSHRVGALNTGPRPPTAGIVPRTPPEPGTHSPKPTRRRMLTTLLITVLLLAGSLLSLLLLIAQSSPPKGPIVAPNPLVGSVSFLSSGQLDPTSSQGLNDTIIMSLHNLSPPARGQSYYAWLMPDPTDDTTRPVLLGRLSLAGGTAQLTYSHPDHANLLASYSGVEVAEQPSSQMPPTPPLDPKLWRYVGSLPNTPIPDDEKYYSLLSHMRHLLAKDPTLQQIGLQGGLDIWLYRNSEKILEWSSAARDSWAGGQQTDLIHRHLLRVLDYLDGAAYVSTSGDIPSGSPLLVDPQMGRMGLLEVSPTQVLPAYLTHVDLHLKGVINAPGHSQAQRQLAIKVDNALKTDTSLFQKVRQDAVQLVKMSATQLKSKEALTLLNDMVTTANSAYTGQFDPTSGGTSNGIVWIHNALQGLAIMPVMAAATNKP
jgi:TIR domain